MSGVPPNSAIRALILGSARAALVSWLSFSTISAGVAFGAPSPEPNARFIARHELAHRRNVRQRLRAGRGRRKAQPGDQRSSSADPKIKARMAQSGGNALTGSPADFGKLVAEETEKWAKVIRAANIKAE